MKIVSQDSIASCDGRVPSSPMPPVVYGLSSGTQALPRSALMIGAPSTSAACSSSSPACRAPCQLGSQLFSLHSECRLRVEELIAAEFVATAHRYRNYGDEH